MNSWQDIQKEIEKEKSFDKVRRDKYKVLVQVTQRPLIVYGTAFTQPTKNMFHPLMAIDLSDKEGFSEVSRKIDGDKVDILIHSPGGSAEATESIVKIIRSEFSDVRFLVAGVAKSAATMLALSGNSIVMTESAEMGPIDPQIRVRNRFSPAGSIIEQFEKASKQIQENPEMLPAWLPILQEYAPCLLIDCENFIELAEKLVKSWMKNYMFNPERGKKVDNKINRIAKYLTNGKKQPITCKKS